MSPERNGGQEEKDSGHEDAARPDDVDGLLVSDGFRNGIHDHGKVSSDVVHDEEKQSDAGGLDLGDTDLRDDGEEDGEPGLSREVVAHQADERIRWLKEAKEPAIFK